MDWKALPPDELGKRIREARLERNWALRDLDKAAGVSTTYIDRIEKGVARNVSDEVLTKVLVAVGLESGKRARLVPVFAWGAAGDPMSAELMPDPIDELELTEQSEGYDQASETTFALKIKGSSMTNRKIHDGDVVLVTPGKRYRQNDVVVARVDGQLVVKVWRSDGLYSDGDDGNDRIPVESSAYVIGPAVFRMGSSIN